VQVANQIALKVVQVSAEGGSNHFPFSIVTKNLSISNDGDNFAGLWVGDGVVRHVRRLRTRDGQTSTLRRAFDLHTARASAID
jgi:hypothetical protein